MAGTLDEQTCLRLVREAAEGLAVAHAKHIVHRDIKSSNLMLTADGRVKIMDENEARENESGSEDEK